MSIEQSVQDKELLKKFSEGHRMSAINLSRRHSSKILTLAYRLLKDRNEAEDITQEVFIRLWQNADKLHEGKGKISTWLYRVTTNKCIDVLRKRKKYRDNIKMFTDTSSAVTGDAKYNYENEEKHVQLFVALELLTTNQKVAIVLKNLEEKSIAETASFMNLSTKAVESLLVRGRASLKNILIKKINSESE